MLYLLLGCFLKVTCLCNWKISMTLKNKTRINKHDMSHMTIFVIGSLRTKIRDHTGERRSTWTMENTRVQWRRVQWRRQFRVTLDCFVDILQRCSIFILYYICIKSTIWGLLKRHFKFQNELPGIIITMVFQQALVSPLTIIFPFSFDYLVCVMSGMALKQSL